MSVLQKGVDYDDDDDIQESDISDDEQERTVIHPGSFVDYLYLRYEPAVTSVLNQYGPYLSWAFNGARSAGGVCRIVAWKLTTSMILYMAPVMIAMERQQQWDAYKKKVEATSSDISSTLNTATTTPEGLANITLKPPPGGN
mmetsp:Transcript_33063/g.80347  ORF Transcript_33063/g.80347 Transcript_33063/m.80347 type:complete len:142 (-) Transcript_33063:334-759(-)